ncbi:hypothetical protein M3P05_05125 [Sansalvadorimonas sp. 2012CJ34-2]|uniref:Uncharacterized protein n=1 Tax=Parendozoicomonas callyspongiae TaxID=2942213 RepID=A0ABT0PDN2_9GAMM|nr:hypothetical protein [Sansalvadorimonas sp. 2012CJ34-2]MCL6269326.1 hypothetical protein [Sansalvadorimonas sp. 2012CJ34-2]
MGLVVASSIVAILLVSGVLAHFTEIGFVWWFAGIPLGILMINVLFSVSSWVSEKMVDEGVDLNLVEQVVLSHGFFEPDSPLFDDIPESEKAIIRKSAPLWSHSLFADTIPLKVSKNPPFERLSNDLWSSEEGDYGFQINYGSAHPSRFFLQSYSSGSDVNYRNKLISWQGKVSDRINAVDLPFEDGPEGFEVHGATERYTVLSLNFEYQHIRQVLLLDHSSNHLTAISKRQEMAGMKLEYGDRKSYAIVVAADESEIYIVFYLNEKNYDDFFSARGRYIPRSAELWRISFKNNESQLISRLILSKHGMPVAMRVEMDGLLIDTVDERNLKKVVWRRWKLAMHEEGL